MESITLYFKWIALYRDAGRESRLIDQTHLYSRMAPLIRETLRAGAIASGECDCGLCLGCIGPDMAVRASQERWGYVRGWPAHRDAEGPLRDQGSA